MKRRSKATNTATTDRTPLISRFHFVGGKGGAGKTTCAASIAIAAAKNGRRTLVISTDPAPSLGDALELSLSSRPRRVAVGRGTLHAIELDARKALDRWLAPRRHAFELMALRGTWLDEADVAALLRLSLPGIDEVAALLEIARLGTEDRYDLIVVDTAPTGHTLRMLTMPETLRRVASVFDAMQEKHRVIVQALTGTYVADEADRIIGEIDGEGRMLTALLRDPASTRVTWVTLPEPMSIDETVAAADSLAKSRIPLHDLIVNRLTTPAPDRCRWCDARRALEQEAIRRLPPRVRRVRMIGVTARDREPRGVRALARIGVGICSGGMVPTSSVGSAGSTKRTVSARLASHEAARLFQATGARLLLFGGKGGVGKTTCAAAAALTIAASTANPVLLLSTDPAHSLGDVLGQSIGDRPRRVRGGAANLRVREINASKELERVRVRYAQSIDALFDRLAGGRSGAVHVDAAHDRKAMHGLIDLAPPGIDELVAIIAVVDRIHHDRVQTLVIDTAPTGHALRLLEMPELVHDWVKALMSILLKYQPVASLDDFGPALVTLSRGLSRLRALLADRTTTSFIVVTRGAALPREETRDVIGQLTRMNVHVPAVLINAVGRGTCRRCRAQTAIERRHVKAMKREIPSTTVMVIAPGQMPPPMGAANLRRWQHRWMIDRAGAAPGV